MRKAFLLLFLTPFFLIAQKEAVTAEGDTVILYSNGRWESKQLSFTGLQLPKANSEDVIHHQAYSLVYSEEHEQASWIAYKLKKEDLVKKASRKDDFRPDPLIKTGSADKSDYKGSGYDRGHLAPAGDMVRSEEVMSESFYFSNMSPQVPTFNRGEWRLLEERVRTWTKQFDSLYIVTGPVFNDTKGTIGSNQVSIPKQYYKVLLTRVDSGFIGIGFLMNNSEHSENYELYAKSIDEIETVTGIDFFPLLSDEIENKVESSWQVQPWDISEVLLTPVENEDEISPPIEQNSVQCKGKTNSGNRCKRKTSDSSGYCYQHKK